MILFIRYIQATSAAIALSLLVATATINAAASNSSDYVEGAHLSALRRLKARMPSLSRFDQPPAVATAAPAPAPAAATRQVPVPNQALTGPRSATVDANPAASNSHLRTVATPGVGGLPAAAPTPAPVAAPAPAPTAAAMRPAPVALHALLAAAPAPALSRAAAPVAAIAAAPAPQAPSPVVNQNPPPRVAGAHGATGFFALCAGIKNHKVTSGAASLTTLAAAAVIGRLEYMFNAAPQSVKKAGRKAFYKAELTKALTLNAQADTYVTSGIILGGLTGLVTLGAILKK